MEEGTILQWLKAEGNSVAKDEVLFELETDKAIIEVVAPEDGILLKIEVPSGPVLVDSIVGWIGGLGDTVKEASPKQVEDAEPPMPTIAQNDSKHMQSKIVATPAARRRATELGIDLASIRVSAPGTRIVLEDVERAIILPNSSPEELTSRLLSRKVLIERLTSTWQSVPHIYIARCLDATGLMKAKKHLVGAGTSVTDLILWMLSKILPDFPELTMIWGAGKLHLADSISIAFAVDTNRGVVAPVVASETMLSLASVTARRRELMEAAQAGRLRVEDLQGGVFTLTNLGMQGVDFFTPLINSPQTAILATGKMSQAPIVVDDVIAVGWRMWVNLAVDHRVTDGMAAARFLEKLQSAVTKLPEELGGYS